MHIKLQESTVVKQSGVTSKGPSEFVQEITFQKLTPGSVIAFRSATHTHSATASNILSFYPWFINKCISILHFDHKVLCHCSSQG